MNDVDSDRPTPADRDDWPNSVRSRTEVDDALAKGRASGLSKRNILQVAARARSRLGSGE